MRSTPDSAATLSSLLGDFDQGVTIVAGGYAGDRSYGDALVDDGDAEAIFERAGGLD